MAGKKSAGENSKKAAGNAKKAEAAAQKAAANDRKQEAAESAEWSKGAKSNAKKEAEAAKKEEQARKKAEKAALEAEEAKNTPSGGPKNSKTAVKKTGRGTLDLSQLDAAMPALNASGIDNALDALGVAGNSQDKIDKHPERRFKAAYAAYEERRLTEMESDGSGAGLRLNQKKDRIRKEFEKSPDNPFNQVTAQYNSTREDLADIRTKEKSKVEARLGSK